MPQLFSNGARNELASPITATSTSITLKGLGQLFPACNYAGSSVLSQTSTENWIKLVIQDDAGFEIVYCYMHEASTNVFSNLKRGQEGTTARVFAADSVVGLRPIGGDLQALVNQTKANTEALVAKADKIGDISGNAGTTTKLKNPVAIGGVLFDGSVGIDLPGVNNPGNQNTTGNAGTATKLQTARAIAVGGSTKNFDGTAPIIFTLAEVGAAEAVHSHTAASTTEDGFMSAADKVKLNGIATGATANQTNAFLLSRANHTGTQDIATVTGLQTALDSKADSTTVAQAITDAKARASHTGPLNWSWATYDGTANTVTLAPAFTRTAYATGDEFRFRATATNTGAVTINVNGLGAKTAVTVTGAALPAGYIRTGVDTVCVYDGTNFVVQREVEIGSNANGRYVKEADGRLTCAATATADTPVSMSWGSSYLSVAVLMSFPHAFVGPSNDVAYKRADRYIAGESAAFGLTQVATTTTITSYVVSPVSSGRCRLGYEATGRWY